MKIKNLILAVAAVGITFAAEAQSYYVDNLVATNTFLATFPTNLVSANYFQSANPNIVVPGNGYFANPLNQPNFAAEGGVAYQLSYAQVSSTNAAVAAAGPLATNLVATFALVLDDATIKDSPTLSGQTYTVTFALSATATNPGTLYTATAQGPLTNTMNFKWSKLVGFAATGYTNGLVIGRLKAGYPLPQ